MKCRAAKRKHPVTFVIIHSGSAFGCQNVQLGDHTGSSTLLCRYLLAARLDFRADVFIVLPAGQKRTGQRRPGRRSLKVALEQCLSFVKSA